MTRSTTNVSVISLVLLLILPRAVVAFAAPNDISRPAAIPITVLSGFLGSGKTTLLQHLLENQQGLRIAVVVNDVASVNIDSKLVSSSSPEKAMAAGMVELQNGCACCSLSEELLTSVSELVTLSDLRADDKAFHHIVIELSGVADPKSVRAKFQEAMLYGMPLMERVCLDTMVTVVDCSVFLNHLASSRLATPDDSPELFYRDGEKPPPREQEDWMKDVPGPLLEALLAGNGASPAMPETDSAVTELLVAQTETADVLLLNKLDLVDDDTTEERIKQVVQALNPRATIIPTTFGKVPLNEILGVAGGQGVVEAGVVDDHRDAVHAVDVTTAGSEASTASSHNHEHVHDHDACADPNCKDPSHDHSHSHDHHQASADPDSTGANSSHSHSHDHAATCADPDCTDPSHDHSSHASSHAGISSFVFRARRPFHPKRLVSFLNHLPVVRGLPADGNKDKEIADDGNLRKILKKVLRSKGFVWCADSNVAALYWSHAGSSFDMQCLGRWWATLPREQWPPEATPTLLLDFDDPNHVEEQEGALSATVGDRRQEIVFVGTGLEERAICDSLQKCLLTDDEWKLFQTEKKDEQRLRTAFANVLEARMASY